MHLAWLEEIVGTNKGNQFVLGEEEYRLGRGVSSEIRLSDARISHVHASIRFHNGFFILLDMNSTNGTFVNGIRIQETRLSKGDRIRLGDTELVFNLGEPDPPTLTYSREEVRVKLEEKVIPDSIEAVPPPGTRICPYCDSNIPNQMTHCSACGAPVDVVVVEKIVTQPSIEPPSVPTTADIVDGSPSTEVVNIPVESKARKKRPSRKLIVAIGILFSCLCIAGITFICVLTSGSSGPSRNDTLAPTAGVSLYRDDEYPVTITSEEYYEGEEAEDFALVTMSDRDPGMIDTLRFAEAEGYISIGEAEILSAARITIGDGKVFDLFQLGTGPFPKESIIVLQGGLSIEEFEQAATFFLRFEDDEDDPKLILYHLDGAVEITENRLEIVAESDSEAITSFSPKGKLMSPNPADVCKTTNYQDWKNCFDSKLSAEYGLACASALLGLKAAMTTAVGAPPVGLPVLAPFIIFAVSACGYPAWGCIPYAADQPPAYETFQPLTKLEGKNHGWCTANGQYAINEPVYGTKIKWDDDRRPFDSLGLGEYTGPLAKVMTITAVDCSGQSETVKTTNLKEFEVQVSKECKLPERCAVGSDGLASCVPDAESESNDDQLDFDAPIFDDSSGGDQETLVYSGSILEPPTCTNVPSCERTKNEISVTLPKDGGDFSGKGVMSWKAAYTDGCPVTSMTQNLTITGTYDPETGSLTGILTYITNGAFYVNDDCELKVLERTNLADFIGMLSGDKITGTIENKKDDIKANFELKVVE